jgi:ketosteroid isomerase-like protein
MSSGTLRRDIPNAAVANGRDALITNFQDWLGACDAYRSTPEEIVERSADTVLLFAQESARGKDSGIDVHSRRVTGVYELRDGRIVRLKAYLDRTEALLAARLRE